MPHPVSRRATRRPVLSAAVAVLLVLSAVGAGAAQAHFRENDGTWTYRYHTRTDNNDAKQHCDNNTGKVDPLNIIFYKWGEWSRMFDHVNGETHWFNFTIGGSGQVLCQRLSGYAVVVPMREQAQGHGFEGTRAHYRIFPSGHGHEEQFRWSTIDVHHEECCGHAIDENWETWENHLAHEMDVDVNNSGKHNVWHDYYYRAAAAYFRGWYDNGYVTRVGGDHL